MDPLTRSYIEALSGMIEFKPYVQEELLPTPKVKVGDKLNHKRFGEGHVIEVIDSEKVLIQFNGFTKILLTKFAGFKTLQ